MSSQTDSQNLSNEVEVDVQEPDCLSQTSSSFVEVIALNVLLSSVIGPSGEILTRDDLNQMRSGGGKDSGPRFSDTQIGDLFLRIRGPLLENPHLTRETKVLLQRGVVIKEPSPNSVRPSLDEVLGKDKEKVVEPSPKVKPTLKQAPSSSKAA
ncbi:hypothetical protein Adt_05304 [Abeliophyllum distichum]|uniref:Uncharacterized protein n=1 Tax=Abeliophyllum distichum TaxID=126358 RepID=A0ABD1V4W8_9LAMI